MTTTEPRPWLKNYPSGVPANIDINQYATLVQMVEEAFQKYRDKTAFTCMGKELTFGEVDKLSRDFGAYLQSRGLEQGDRVIQGDRWG